MDKKTRKANKAIEDSKNFLKNLESKRKKVSQPLIPPPPSPKTMNYWICEGESVKLMTGILKHHLDCKTIQGKRSILLKGQCVLIHKVSIPTSCYYVIIASDGRQGISYINPTNTCSIF